MDGPPRARGTPGEPPAPPPADRARRRRIPGSGTTVAARHRPLPPPARHPFSDTDDNSPDEADHATFPTADPAHPLAPPVPDLPDEEGVDEWINHPDNLPDLDELGIRTDSQDRQWIVLYEQAMDDHDGRGWNVTRGQAEQWHRIHSWLVPAPQLTSLLTWLEGRSFTNRLMPEGPDRHSLLLADFPTVPGPWTDPEPDSWSNAHDLWIVPWEGMRRAYLPDDPVMVTKSGPALHRGSGRHAHAQRSQ